MGKKRGGWRKFFCCTGPPETQSSTCLNIASSEQFKPPSELDPSEPDPSEVEPDQDPEDGLYVENEIQTSKMDIPEGNRWRWSRLHKEVEQQTSRTAVLIPEIETSSEADVQVQTSFSSLPRGREAQAQTSFLSLRSPTPVENDAQVQTSFMELPREAEAQVQTSLLSLPGEKEMHAQTSFSSLPERRSVASFAGSAQSSSSYLELLEKFPSLPMLSEAQVQTSHLDIRVPSEIDIQLQTSFLDYMSEREYASSSEPQSKLSPQSSVIEQTTIYPVYIDTGVQTIPVEIPPGNDWRSARLNTAAQVQTSFASMTEQRPMLGLEKDKETAGEVESLFSIEEAPLPFERTERAMQTSESLLRQWKKWHSLQPQSDAQVQTSTIELLKRLSLLSRIQSMESASRAELLKKASSLSVGEPHMQTSSPELLRKASSWSNSGVQDQILSDELLKKRPSSAQVLRTSDYELARLLSPKSTTKEAQIQTSEVELINKLLSDRSTDTLFRKSSSASYIKPQERTSDTDFPKSHSASFAKTPEKILDSDFQSYASMSHAEPQKRVSDTDIQKYSSLSLIEGGDDNQEALTEGKEFLITPQVMEAQIRKWYHELPEVQTSASQKEPLWTPTIDSEVQTSHVEIPYGNKWRESRLQTEAQVQTSGLKVPVEKAESFPQLQKANQTQTSLLEIWRARELAEAQNQTCGFDEAETGEFPHALLVDSHAQTSDFDFWKAKEQMDIETQTSVDKILQQGIRPSPTEQVDKLVQTSFLDLGKSKDYMQQKASGTDLTEPERTYFTPLQSDFEVETDTQAQRSISDFLEAQKEPSLAQQTNAEVQTSNIEIPGGSSWRSSRLHSDVQQQTSLEFDEEESEAFPSSQKDIQSQTSLLDIWKAKQLHDAQIQTSWMDFPTDVEDPFLSPQSESPSEYFMPEEEQSPPPALLDAQMQTSLLDIWKAKELHNAQKQTSWIDVPEPMEEPFLPPQSESPIEPHMLEMEEAPLPGRTDNQVQTSFSDRWWKKERVDAEMQSSLADLPQGTKVVPLLPPQSESPLEPAELEIKEAPPPTRMENQVQTSFSDIWRKKERADAEMQSSLGDLPQVTKVVPLLPQPESPTEPAVVEKEEAAPPTRMDNQVQTSFSDIWRKKERADAKMQSSLADLPQVTKVVPLLPQPESPIDPPELEIKEGAPPTRMDNQVQTSFSDIWRKKERADAKMQSSLADLPQVTKVVPLLPQPESPTEPAVVEKEEAAPPARMENQVQTSFSDIWRKKERADAKMQSSLADLPQSESPIDPPELEIKEGAPPTRMDNQVQTSFSDIWRKKERVDAKMQSSLADLPQGTKEVPLLPQSERPTEPAELEIKEGAPPTRIDNQMQTSFSDIWQKKERADAEIQSSLGDLPQVTKVVPLLPQSESPIEPAVVEIKEAAPPGRMDNQVQTSFSDIWRKKERADAEMQSSLADLPQGTKEVLLPSKAESPIQSPMPDSVDTAPEFPPPTEPKEPTSLPEMPETLKPVDVPKSLPPSPSGSKDQTSQPDMQTPEELPIVQEKSSKTSLASAKAVTPVSSHTSLSPVPSQTAVSPAHSRTAVSPALSRTAVSPAHSRTAVSPALSRTSVSPAHSRTAVSPAHSRTAVSPAHSRTAVSPALSHTASPSHSRTAVSPALSRTVSPALSRPAASPASSHPPVSPVPPYTPVSPAASEIPSPVRPPSPASLYAEEQHSDLAEQKRASMEKTLLELWTTREEAEVQKQTDQLQLHLEDLPLFPKLEDSQVEISEVMKPEGKKPKQVSKVAKKSKAPAFAEAQVQTSFVEIPRGKKWRASRIFAEAQVQTSFQDLHVKERAPVLRDHVAAKRVPRGPKRAAPVSVHLHVKMSPKRQTSNEKK
ncbi:uncharacterized protein LOC128400095 [Podarcis raffonei]|uniref:uncharacterized protein LOC128400095 n=1 Tax=Podarcis raffonei TaxID=65483 RepID=UPI0023290C39|nr:uncharacterized protein LOC128400095 [Podarcis raffonei]